MVELDLVNIENLNFSGTNHLPRFRQDQAGQGNVDQMLFQV